MKGNSANQTPEEELLTLIKNSAQEGQFHKISTTELDTIYRRGLALILTAPHDKELARAVIQFKTEIENRRSGKTMEPQEHLIRRLADKILRRKGIAITVGIIIILAALFFRYGEEYIQGRLFRYDRFTMTVQQKSGVEWVPIPQFKNLQHVRDFMARRERNRQNEERNRQNEELRRNIEELTDTVETMKRKQQVRDLYRSFGK